LPLAAKSAAKENSKEGSIRSPLFLLAAPILRIASAHFSVSAKNFIPEFFFIMIEVARSRKKICRKSGRKKVWAGRAKLGKTWQKWSELTGFARLTAA